MTATDPWTNPAPTFGPVPTIPARATLRDLETHLDALRAEARATAEAIRSSTALTNEGRQGWHASTAFQRRWPARLAELAGRMDGALTAAEDRAGALRAGMTTPARTVEERTLAELRHARRADALRSVIEKRIRPRPATSCETPILSTCRSSSSSSGTHWAPRHRPARPHSRPSNTGSGPAPRSMLWWPRWPSRHAPPATSSPRRSPTPPRPLATWPAVPFSDRWQTSPWPSPATPSLTSRADTPAIDSRHPPTPSRRRGCRRPPGARDRLPATLRFRHLRRLIRFARHPSRIGRRTSSTGVPLVYK